MSSMAKCFLTISVLIFNGAEKRLRGSKFLPEKFKLYISVSSANYLFVKIQKERII